MLGRQLQGSPLSVMKIPVDENPIDFQYITMFK